MTSYNYYDGNYTEQEVAVYEYEDEETKRVLLEQIAANRTRIEELVARLETAERQLEIVDGAVMSGISAIYHGICWEIFNYSGFIFVSEKFQWYIFNYLIICVLIYFIKDNLQ